jgi:hypothetical protein
MIEVHGPHKYISTTRVEDKYSILRKDYAKSLDSCKGTLFTHSIDNANTGYHVLRQDCQDCSNLYCDAESYAKMKDTPPSLHPALKLGTP